MTDGVNIKTSSDEPYFYDTKESFFYAPPFWNTDYNFISSDSLIYNVGDFCQVNGYDDRFVGLWEKVRFGEWVSEYDLDSTKEYFCAWIKYVKYVPILSDSTYLPVLPMSNMGFIPWNHRKVFDIEYQQGWPKEVFYTYIRYIGYDNNRKGLYMELPTNNIIWNFTVNK